MNVTFRCPPELDGIVPEPVPAKLSLPDWFLRAPDSAPDCELGEDVATFKQCRPFADAMGSGFFLPLACDVRVSEGRFSWNWQEFPAISSRNAPRSPMSFHAAAQSQDSPFHGDGTALVRFMTFWAMVLEPGFSLLVTHPFNRADLPFRTLSGLVTAETCADTYLHVPAVWTDPQFSGVLPRGTPVAQCLPVSSSALDVECITATDETADDVRASLHEVNAEAAAGRRLA